MSCTHVCRIVALLERVQGGIIGQTLSSFGITGLYITFVFGIGRFLRFSTQHARMRIPFEDLPTTKRLIALCQACNSILRPHPYAQALQDLPDPPFWGQIEPVSGEEPGQAAVCLQTEDRTANYVKRCMEVLQCSSRTHGGSLKSLRAAGRLQDIYIARAEGELELEEELYWALINIYRSPAVMFEITRKKAE